ncbi:MAG TPA: poly-gamma-glutamate biosynthesis protein PgsC/CapC [Anaerolineaceae bacterium]|nr:poly-gamma-glutamate biosynthesis protein PgsC/CapC [Anaerolineaceae bacterium]
MYAYPYSVELARLTIILGIVVSILIYKKSGMTMGGILIPGYLALFVSQPLHIIVTLIIATLSYLLVHNTLKKRFMLNGRRLFEVEILVALILQISWSAVLTLFGGRNSALASLYGIGFVIPGLITHEIGRQGLSRTLFTTLLGTLFVFLIITPIAAIEQALPQDLTVVSTSPILRTQPYPYAFPLSLLPFAIVISIMVDMLIYTRLKIRPGGFVTAAYIALFVLRPLDLLFILLATVLTYLFVTFMANRFLLVFGRVRFGLIILSSVVISWLLEILVINLSQGLYAPWSGFVIIMPMLVALLTNSFDQRGIPKTIGALGLSTTLVWLVMFGLVSLLKALNLLIYFTV